MMEPSPGVSRGALKIEALGVALAASDAVLLPSSFTARTLKVYRVPLLRPVTV